MPNMDGFELLAAVRQHTALAEMPFVLLSARSDASDLQQAFALGADDYLVKPFEVDQLMDVIRCQLAESPDLDHAVHRQGCATADSDFYLE